MKPAEILRILICADEPGAVADLQAILESSGYAISWHPLRAGKQPDVAGYHLLILDESRCPEEARRACRNLRRQALADFLPILVVTGDHAPQARLSILESGADSYLLRPFTAGELLANVQAFRRFIDWHDLLHAKTAEVQRMNKHLQFAYQQIDQGLDLARHIQRSLLPSTLLEVPSARFAVHYRPCGKAGGDCYNVFRLDEDHVGLFVADAVGQDIPASLLSLYLRGGMHSKEISGSQYRLVPPGEVLQRLNHDLLGWGLPEHRFITMVYAVLNRQNGTLQLARAGHPHPLYVPIDGDPEVWSTGGGLLGIFETEFPALTRTLRPRDKVLFYTNGADAVSFEGRLPGTESLLACAARHQGLSLEEFLERFVRDLKWPADQTDDVTVLGLEITESG